MTSFTKHFSSFDEAFNFRKNCPYCNKLTVYEPKKGSSWQSITDNIFTDYSLSLSVKVNMETNEIVSLTAHNPFGTFYTGLKISCTSCLEYNYYIKIVIDLQNKKVKEISLNSETCYWFSNDNSYKIYISYSFSEIEIEKYSSGIFSDKFKLPLVNLNVFDRPKMLEAINSYATFL